MIPRKKVVIIGAGPGGLCAAMILAHRGFSVTVLEKKDRVGGRNAALELDGFTFDTGPTFLMMRFVLEAMFAEAGHKAGDYLKFHRLDPMYRLLFSQDEIRISADPNRTRAEISRVFPEGAAGFDRFLAREGKRYSYLYPCIQKDYSTLRSMLSWPLLRGAPFLGLGRSVFGNLGRYFRDERLRVAFSFQSKYLGMSPWKCPAFFTMLSYIEHRYGIEHVTGGLNRLSIAMAEVARTEGADVRLNAPVDQLVLEGRRVRGVRVGSETIPCDELIINADFSHAMERLVPPGILRKYTPPKLKRKEYSCSTFMLYLGLRKRYDFPHHNVIFADDYRAHVDSIFGTKTLHPEFSFYVQNACVTDPTLAPAGKSTLYVLVPVPNNLSGIDWAKEKAGFRARVLSTVAKRLEIPDLIEQIEVERMTTPQDWEAQGDIYAGATFSLSHKFSQLLYLRPRNRFEELDHCYLVGGGTHPGSGLPTIYESARISANMISAVYDVPFEAPSTEPLNDGMVSAHG